MTEFDERQSAFFCAGSPVPSGDIRRELARIREGISVRLVWEAGKVVGGEMGAADFCANAGALLREAHTDAARAGGADDDWAEARAGQAVDRLTRFLEEPQAIDVVERRLVAEADAVSATFEEARRRSNRVAGFRWERRVPGASCGSACHRYASRGWVKAGELPAVEDCLCTFDATSVVPVPPGPPSQADVLTLPPVYGFGPGIQEALQDAVRWGTVTMANFRDVLAMARAVKLAFPDTSDHAAFVEAVGYHDITSLQQISLYRSTDVERPRRVLAMVQSGREAGNAMFARDCTAQSASFPPSWDEERVALWLRSSGVWYGLASAPLVDTDDGIVALAWSPSEGDPDLEPLPAVDDEGVTVVFWDRPQPVATFEVVFGEQDEVPPPPDASKYKKLPEGGRWITSNGEHMWITGHGDDATIHTGAYKGQSFAQRSASMKMRSHAEEAGKELEKKLGRTPKTNEIIDATYERLVEEHKGDIAKVHDDLKKAVSSFGKGAAAKLEKALPKMKSPQDLRKFVSQAVSGPEGTRIRRAARIAKKIMSVGVTVADKNVLGGEVGAGMGWTVAKAVLKKVCPKMAVEVDAYVKKVNDDLKRRHNKYVARLIVMASDKAIGKVADTALGPAGSLALPIGVMAARATSDAIEGGKGAVSTAKIGLKLHAESVKEKVKKVAEGVKTGGKVIKVLGQRLMDKLRGKKAEEPKKKNEEDVRARREARKKARRKKRKADMSFFADGELEALLVPLLDPDAALAAAFAEAGEDEEEYGEGDLRQAVMEYATNLIRVMASQLSEHSKDLAPVQYLMDQHGGHDDEEEDGLSDEDMKKFFADLGDGNADFHCPLASLDPPVPVGDLALVGCDGFRTPAGVVDFFLGEGCDEDAAVDFLAESEPEDVPDGPAAVNGLPAVAEGGFLTEVSPALFRRLRAEGLCAGSRLRPLPAWSDDAREAALTDALEDGERRKAEFAARAGAAARLCDIPGPSRRAANRGVRWFADTLRDARVSVARTHGRAVADLVPCFDDADIVFACHLPPDTPLAPALLSAPFLAMAETQPLGAGPFCGDPAPVTSADFSFDLPAGYAEATARRVRRGLLDRYREYLDRRLEEDADLSSPCVASPLAEVLASRRPAAPPPRQPSAESLAAFREKSGDASADFADGCPPDVDAAACDLVTDEGLPVFRTTIEPVLDGGKPRREGGKIVFREVVDASSGDPRLCGVPDAEESRRVGSLLDAASGPRVAVFTQEPPPGYVHVGSPAVGKELLLFGAIRRGLPLAIDPCAFSDDEAGPVAVRLMRSGYEVQVGGGGRLCQALLRVAGTKPLRGGR